MRYITRLVASAFSALVLVGVVGLAGAVPAATAASLPGPPNDGPDSPFYTYTGSTPLAEVAPGTVLASRAFSSWGFWWPVTEIQLLYRTTTVLGQPTTNVSTVLLPNGGSGPARAVSYESAYDSLNRADEPSVTLSGGGSVPDVSNFLSNGVTVIVPDTEGQNTDITEGREYGMNTLDSIRAATSSPLTGLSSTTPVAMMGYSGGAWAAQWAAQLAPTYAPDVNAQLVGTAVGGLPVDAAHIATYLSGNKGNNTFSPEIVVALIGMSKAYHVDFTPYLTSDGLAMYRDLENASLSTAISSYKHVTLYGPAENTWFSTTHPVFKVNPNTIPGYTAIVNNENLGLVGPATTPLYIVQGATGWVEGADDSIPGIGNGDGATITGDVRTLARQACAAGTTVSYTELGWADHLMADLSWASGSKSWINDRFAGVAAPNTCSSIAPGNSLAAE